MVGVIQGWRTLSTFSAWSPCCHCSTIHRSRALQKGVRETQSMRSIRKTALSWSPSSLACLHPLLTFQGMNIISPISFIPIVMYRKPFSQALSIFHSHNLFGSPSSLLTTFLPPDLFQSSVTSLSQLPSFAFPSFPICPPTTSQILNTEF